MLPRSSGSPKKAKRIDVDDASMKEKNNAALPSSARTAALSLLEIAGDEQTVEKLVAECRERVDDG